jgi:TM2 domain-containing membrane protein YozV
MLKELLEETIIKSCLSSESIKTGINSINREKSITFAYFMWFLCIFLIFGMQRIYLKRYVSGFLYLFTFGFLGVGQIIDLFLIPEIIKQVNQQSANSNSSRSNFNLLTSLSKNKNINTQNKQSILSFQGNPYKNEVNNLSFQDPNPAYLDLAILTYLRKNENASFIDLLSNLQCDKQLLRDRLLILQEEEFIKIINKTDENNTIYKML